MAEEDTDPDSKTEDPSDRRKDEFLDKGQTAISQELVGAAAITGAFGAIGFQLANMRQALVGFSYGTWKKMGDRIQPEAVAEELIPASVEAVGYIVGPLVFGALVCGVIASIAQGGGMIRWKILEPKPEKLNPAGALKKMFSKDSMGEMVAGVFKLSIVWIATFFSAITAVKLMIAGSITPTQAVASVGIGMKSIAIRGTAVLLALGLIDHLRKRRKMNQQMKMTKDEAKRERKDEEGDPLMKQRRRDQARAAMKKPNPIIATQNATVVITNPIHYAVALEYRAGTMAAPRVVAKGAGAIAARIRAVAEEHRVPIVENPPLARALFRSVKIGQAIPIKLYEAVARVLAKIFEVARNRARMQGRELHL